jgi:O-acetyl-ADP-ribose deacetylase (regulator of RNase III)
MREVKGNIWEFYRNGYYVVIPTNGCVKKNGRAVMGKGLALQCTEFFNDVSLTLGRCINTSGNVLYLLDGYRLITFPTKDHWSEDSNLNLINKSAQELLELADMLQEEMETVKIALPKVGCGCGNLSWYEVRNILFEYLDDRFVVVDLA